MSKHDTQMEDIVIIGSGNVAEALALALTKAGRPPVQIFARNRDEGTRITSKCQCKFTDKAANLKQADLYIIAVSDKAISGVSGSLNFGDAVVAHTSGSTPLNALSPSIRNRAVLYPLQTFTKGHTVDFGTIPIMVEGATPKALAAVTAVAELLSGNVTEVASKQRAVVHVAAVFACNFTNHMYAVGELLAKEAGMDFDILKPLIKETAGKALAADSPLATQTGPAIRNDFQTKSLHCELLAEKPDLKNLYISISKSIWETSKKTSQK